MKGVSGAWVLVLVLFFLLVIFLMLFGYLEVGEVTDFFTSIFTRGNGSVTP